MVLQADKTVPVWGEAGAGNEVTVQFAEQQKVAVADASGRWKVVLDPMPVSNQTRDLTVTTTGDSAASLPTAHASADPRDLILSAVEKGTQEIKVPPGTYRLAQKDKVFLTLEGVRDTVIDCTGVTFIGLAHTVMLELIDCHNVTIKGLAVDYDPLPFTQGVITSIDQDGTWTVDIIEGYPVDDVLLNNDVDMRIQAYCPKTDVLINTLRHGDGVAIEKNGGRTFRVTGGRNREGRMGDIAVFNTLFFDPKIGRKPGAILTKNCRGLVFEDIVLRSSQVMGFVSEGDSGNTYLRCVLDRCPPEDDYAPRGMKRLRSLNADGFHIKRNRVGPLIEDCVARYMADDCVNISGMFSLVTEAEGREIRILASFGEDPDIHPGDMLEMMSIEGARVPDARAVSIRNDGLITPEESARVHQLNLVPFYRDPKTPHMKKAYRVVLDRAADLKFGDVVISGDRVGNGFRIEGNTFGPIRSRPALIKASRGVISGNTITGATGEGVRGAIVVGPEYYWMEGSTGSDILMENNVIENGTAPAIFVGGYLNAPDTPLPAGSCSDIRIVGNTIRRNTAPAIAIHGATGVTINDNILQLTGDESVPAMDLRNVEKLTKLRNKIAFADEQSAP